MLVQVSPDSMEAVLVVPAGVSLPASAVLDRMIKANVIAGVVESALPQAAVPSDQDRRIVVARGEPAIQPVHAAIEVMVNFGLRLEEDGNHKVDFHEQGRFHEADVGTVLAKLIPKAAGKAGRTVLGRELPVSEPKDADISMVSGEGTRVEADGTRVVAERAGLVLKRRDGHIDIMPQVEIRGDLDMHWGNIVTRLPVKIQGDVITGFSLKCNSDAEIKGVIEDARISVKGNLTCGGILPGEHRVKTHGNLTTKHITGRTIKCHDLNVSADIRGVTVYAIGNVAAKVVISSTVQCGGSFTCEDLGHPAELGGIIAVGLNPLAVALYKLANREHAAITAEVAEAKQKVKRLAMWTKTEPDAAKRQQLAHDLKKMLAHYEDSVRRLAECERVLNNATLRSGNNPDATVTITGKVHPGVEIHIGSDAKLAITKPMGSTVFRLKDGRVHWEVGQAGGEGTEGDKAPDDKPA